jgi:hypothetical protein
LAEPSDDDLWQFVGWIKGEAESNRENWECQLQLNEIIAAIEDGQDMDVMRRILANFLEKHDYVHEPHYLRSWKGYWTLTNTTERCATWNVDADVWGRDQGMRLHLVRWLWGDAFSMRSIEMRHKIKKSYYDMLWRHSMGNNQARQWLDEAAVAGQILKIQDTVVLE